MADVTVKRIEEFEAIFGGGFRRARAGLGVTAFGLSVLDFPPNATQYPQHDHGGEGMEEVYTALSGRVTLTAGGEDYELEPGVFARVGPDEQRKLTTGEEGASVLAIGAVQGKPYVPPYFTEEGAPDPTEG